MGRFGHGGNIRSDSVPLAADRLADVDDHVELGRAVGHGMLGFKNFDGGGMSAMGKPDGRSDVDAGALENSRGKRHRVGLDADAGHAVPRRQPAACLRARRGQRRPQQRMVDSLGNRFVGQLKTHGSECSQGSVLLGIGHDWIEWSYLEDG